MVNKTFGGSLPAFIASFTKHQKILDVERNAKIQPGWAMVVVWLRDSVYQTEQVNFTFVLKVRQPKIYLPFSMGPGRRST